MQQQFNESGEALPQAFQLAVMSLAERLGLPAQVLAQAEGFSFDDAEFWLVNYGDEDPHGATILMDLGAPPEDRKELVATTGAWLQYHALIPGVVHGYYGFLPDLNRLVYCTRVALDEVEDGGDAIEDALAACAAMMVEVRAAQADAPPANAGAPGMVTAATANLLKV
jgi:hypothetical protein